MEASLLAIVGLWTSEYTRRAFDFKRRCADWSVYDIKVPREPFESKANLLSYRSRGTLMSYTDYSDLKSNAPKMYNYNYSHLDAYLT